MEEGASPPRMCLGYEAWRECLNGGKEREGERERGKHEIEGGKGGEKLNIELCLTRLSLIKVTKSVTHDL